MYKCYVLAYVYIYTESAHSCVPCFSLLLLLEVQPLPERVVVVELPVSVPVPDTLVVGVALSPLLQESE